MITDHDPSGVALLLKVGNGIRVLEVIYKDFSLGGSALAIYTKYSLPFVCCLVLFGPRHLVQYLELDRQIFLHLHLPFTPFATIVWYIPFSNQAPQPWPIRSPRPRPSRPSRTLSPKRHAAMPPICGWSSTLMALQTPSSTTNTPAMAHLSLLMSSISSPRTPAMRCNIPNTRNGPSLCSRPSPRWPWPL